MRVFPLAVGLAKTRFLHSRTPACMASSCGGYNSAMPLRSVASLSCSGMGSSVTFTLGAPGSVCGIDTNWMLIVLICGFTVSEGFLGLSSCDPLPLYKEGNVRRLSEFFL